MTVKGYGLGEYGTIEPWGSVEYPTATGLHNSVNTDFMGILQAISGIIGESDNELGGLYSTRLVFVGSIGDTEIEVESTLNWSYPGKLAIDGILYYYVSIVGNTIGGLYYINESIIELGLAKIHNVDSEVVNVNENLNAIQLAKKSLLVSYAEDEYLDAIGRKYGVPRKPLYGDNDTYREIIKAIAFAPRGTIYGIELALNALLGVGNYEIYEDLIQYPNVVFIKINESYFLNDTPYGETYISENLFGFISGGSYNTIVLPYSPLKVSYAKLKDLGETFDFRNEIPSDSMYEYFEGNGLDHAFTYYGSASESDVTANGDYTNFNLSSSGSLYYEMSDVQGSRITVDSDVELNFVIRIPSTSSLANGILKQVYFAIYDGSKIVNFGLNDDYSIGLFDTEAGGFIGGSYTLLLDTFYNVKIVKLKNTSVSLYVNGIIVSNISYTSFTTSTVLHKILFGILGAPPTIGGSFDIKQLGIHIKNYKDYWFSEYNNVGSVDSLSPTVFNITGSHLFTSNDVGKYFQVKGSSISNLYGGNNNVIGKIKNVLSTTSIVLEPIEYSRCIIGVLGNNNILKLGDNHTKFTYPDDLGKKIEINNSNLGNNGTYTIIDLLVEGFLENYGVIKSIGSYLTNNKEYTNIAVLNATLIPEENLDIQILISFETESNLDFIHSDTGSKISDTLTLRSGLWNSDLVMDIGISNALSAQLLQDHLVHNNIISTSPLLYKYYPFYLSDVFGELEEFLEDLTIAGVIPKLLGK